MDDSLPSAHDFDPGAAAAIQDSGAWPQEASLLLVDEDTRRARSARYREFGLYAPRLRQRPPSLRAARKIAARPSDKPRNYKFNDDHNNEEDTSCYDTASEQWVPCSAVSRPAAPQLPPTNPISPLLPRWDSLGATNRFFPTPPSSPSSPFNYVPGTPASAVGPVADSRTVAEVEPPSSGQQTAAHESLAEPAQPATARFPGLSSHPFVSGAMVENFSRPRKASIKAQTIIQQESALTSSRQQSCDSVEAHSDNATNPDSRRSATSSVYSDDHATTTGRPSVLSTSVASNAAAPSGNARARARSASSAKSSTLSSLPHRPSHDHLGSSSHRGPMTRHAGHSNSSRHPVPQMPTNSHGNAAQSPSRDAIRWMASNDELRSSCRSQQSASTADATLFTAMGTERSSLLTKTSSLVLAGDEGLSVEDVMGLYEKGFHDDDESVDGANITPAARVDETREADDNESDDGGEHLDLGVFDTPATSDERSQELRIPDAESEPMMASMASANMVTEIQEPVDRDSLAGFESSARMDSAEDDPTRRPPQLVVSRSPEPGEDPLSRDRYGFRKANAYITRQQYDAWDAGYSYYLARRHKKWIAHLQDHSLITSRPVRFPPRSAKTKRYIRKGIPPEWRGAAWFYYAGGPAIVAKHPGLYDDLVRRAGLYRPDSTMHRPPQQQYEVREVDVEGIERDLHRTFPDNLRFKPVSLGVSTVQVPDGSQFLSVQPEQEIETPIISSLRRVLHAFAIYNPRIGYCQSLNFIAGMLLLFVETEEQAFWLLNVVTRIHLPSTHEVSLEGSKVDLGVLMAELRENLPGVWTRVAGDELGGGSSSGSTTSGLAAKLKPGHSIAIRPSRRAKLAGTGGTDDSDDPSRLPPITLCMTPWFMSCFIGTLPIECTLRVWDIFFYEGVRTLFRVALALFKLGEGEIRAVQDPMEMFAVVQAMPRRMLDPNALLEATFKRRNGFGHLSQEDVEKKRKARKAEMDRWKAKMARASRAQEGGTTSAVDSLERAEKENGSSRISQLAMGLDLAADLADVEAVGGSLRRKGTLFGRRREKNRDGAGRRPAEV